MYLFVAAVLFCLGVFTVLARRNAIAILMGVELMLNAVNVNLIAFWRFLTPENVIGARGGMSGQAFAVFVLIVAAAEAAVGLALIIALYRTRQSVIAEEADLMKGSALDNQTLETITWLVPLPPILAFFLISFLDANKALRERWRLINALIAITAILISWGLSIVIVIEGMGRGGEALAEHPIAIAANWYPMGAGDYFKLGVMVDPLTVVGLFFVPLTCAMIFIYSHGYMAHDERYSRFFSYIALFVGAMLTLVVADNLLLLFIGWEVMGLCSYLLIGFWAHKDYPAEANKTTNPRDAAIKAFITTRVGDVIMLLGIAYLFAEIGTLSYRTILRDANVLAMLTQESIIPGISIAGLAGLLLVAGAVGKSAQFPLHTWLPDAMEGPTPVSAMIHAATMVSAGVFMAIRMFPVMSAGFHHHGDFTAPMIALGLIGAFTALFAATMALVQNDVKGVLAYSTISQLGYMMAALGIGAYVAATFHLVTHAIFKALLFMGSGSVIHGMEHGEHHVHEHAHGRAHKWFDAQDMRNMGGLRRKMPYTFWTFLIGGLALSGFPIITSGFWSKDEIIADALHQAGEGYALGVWVFVMLVAAAFLTAFYTMRQIGMTFFGAPRTEAAKHAVESHWTMWTPLVVLAAFTLVIGFLGVHPDFPILGPLLSPAGHSAVHGLVGPAMLDEAPPLAFSLTAPLISIIVALGGLALGWYIYVVRGVKAVDQKDWVEGVLGRFIYNEVLARKYRLDDSNVGGVYKPGLYTIVFVRPTQWVAEQLVSSIMDRRIIDGFLELVARVAVQIGNFFRAWNSAVIDGVGDGVPIGIGRFAAWMRPLQSGKIQQYLLIAAISAIVIGFILVLSLAR
ncbi:MAG: NADH-quinone oxidoreductase subunit L [Anaerolineae bacterium]|nr:NADH-quinone oxidoreductase subunit L [Anaerolineae bacterium]